ncbi:MAG: UDP-N-acetylmuramate:L-alanyl-gamma-D-glutamyl-meso-diaminopimelate ligase, partial [Proteobacteria bacterium]|nr:UDP-N-acetylmuramate:L-alanyl-gamma-D-glutamyl-meso-diaminopimelate ligase [Pseudomonadota bacterium]
AQQKGYTVTGSDEHVYPPMSTQLTEQGIKLISGFDPKQLDPAPNCVVVGNVMKRGLPIIETVLNNKLSFTSGPQWLGEHILSSRRVFAVAGTHGKTTTTSILTWIFEFAQKKPGYLIGGVPNNFGLSAALGDSPYFVIEADEYDTAFFDKRSKFIHYYPECVILNNLEYDHADIFKDLEAIQTQFHHLVRTIPSKGLILYNAEDTAIQAVLKKGCWTPTQSFSMRQGDWTSMNENSDGSAFDVCFQGKNLGRVQWSLLGEHNIHNALGAIAAAHYAGIEVSVAIKALAQFTGIKRRLEVRGQINGVTIYDDFAHHPTAIETTLNGLRRKVGQESIFAVLECASNTMRDGVHKANLVHSLNQANSVYLLRPQPDWGIESLLSQFTQPVFLYDTIDDIVSNLTKQAKPNEHILIMSNKSFGGIHDKLLKALKEK